MLQTPRLRHHSAAENSKLTQLYVLIEGRTLTRLDLGGRGGASWSRQCLYLVLYCGPVVLWFVVLSYPHFLCGDCGAVQ